MMALGSPRISSVVEAEDMTHDLFIRLINYKDILVEDTARSLIFTIARNMIIDYYRRLYKRQEVEDYIIRHYEPKSYNFETVLISKEIAKIEYNKVNKFPPQRRKVYELSRYSELSINEISEKLQLSKRTIENHLRIGRKEIREYINQAI